MKLTAKEKKLIIKELAKQMKATVFENAEQRAEETIMLMRTGVFDSDLCDEVTINYNFTFVPREMLGIIRRTGKLEFKSKNEEELLRK